MTSRRLQNPSLARLPAALLTIVACVQIAAARHGHLVAWKGGGFGMFATIDAPDFRDVILVDAGGKALEIPSHLSFLERRARTFPTQRAIEALARAYEAEAEGLEVAAVEVWQTRFAGMPLRGERIRLARIQTVGP
jgi:hypothetical protein